MRLYNIAGHAALGAPGGTVDVESASEGRFSADLTDLYGSWADFSAWATAWSPGAVPVRPLNDLEIGPPSPKPGQVFAIGLNYRGHAEEAGIELPKEPMVFTKFPSAVTGPYVTVAPPSASVDYEAELVVVIGTGAATSAPRRPGTTSPASPPGRTSRTGGHSCAHPLRSSSTSASRSQGSRRSAPAWSPPTSSPTPTTSRSGVPSTARRCRKHAPVSSCSASSS